MTWGFKRMEDKLRVVDRWPPEEGAEVRLCGLSLLLLGKTLKLPGLLSPGCSGETLELA